MAFWLPALIPSLWPAERTAGSIPTAICWSAAATTRTVSPWPRPTAPILTLPDFARGPGQSVNVSDASNSYGTALTSLLPVALSSTTGVTSVSFELDYNSSYLTVSSVQLAAGISGTLSVTNTTPGVLLVSITGFSSTASAGAIGGTDIVDISASVPAAAISSYGASALLKIVQSESEPGRAVAGSDALEKVVYFGDANADGKLSAADATLVARNRVHLDSGFNAYALTDPRVVGNVTGAGTLASADASLIAQAGVHLAVAKIPTVPSHGTITPCRRRSDGGHSDGHRRQLPGKR